MPFRAPGEGEYTGTKYQPAAADTYRVKVDDYEIRTGEVTKFNKEGNPRVRFYLAPVAIEGDSEAEMVDINDEPLPEDKTFIFFFDPDHLGTKPRLARSRKFMAAVLNIPTDQSVEYDDLKEFCDDALGRELVVDIEVNAESGYNNITDTRPIRKRVVRARAEKTPLVEAAEEVFNEGTTDESDPDEY